MSPEVIITGNEPEYLATHIGRIETVMPGLVRLYWVQMQDGHWRVTHSQLAPDTILPALRNASLFVRASETDENWRDGMYRHH